MTKNRSLIIFGGTGFIGYHLAKKSLHKGWTVTSVSSNKPKKSRRLAKVKYLRCDVSNNKKLKNLIKKKFSYVVNLSGYVDHSNKKKTYQSHYIGCKNIAKIFLKLKPISFVQIGSSLEYGKVNSPQNENQKSKPISVYAQSKYFSTKYLLSIYKKNKFPVTILRLYQAYGPGQELNRLIPIVINSCLNKKKFPCSEGKQYRDFIHVSDVINAIFKSLTKSKSRGQIINIGSGKAFNIKRLIKKIVKLTKGGNPQYGKIKLRKEESLKIFPSITKAKKLLKWKPKVNLNRGLISTIKSFSENKK